MKNDMQYIYRLILDSAMAAKGMRVPEARFIEIMKDGRSISRFAEDYAVKLYPGLKLQPLNHKGSDATGAKDTQYSVKALTKRGTAVRYSGNSGQGRHCHEKDVREFIKQNAVHIFVDNTKFPELSLISINSGVLMEWYQKGSLGKNNGQISYKSFYKQDEVLVREIVDTEIVDIPKEEQ